MSLQVDLYNAFSKGLSSAGKKTAEHSAISQVMAGDITSAIVSCISLAKTTTNYTGVTLAPLGAGAVAVGVGSIDPTPGRAVFQAGVFGLLMDIPGGSGFTSKFATLIQVLFSTSIVTDSYTGTTITPAVPPITAPLTGVGVGTVASPAFLALQAGLVIPTGYVPSSAEVGNNFIATTWSTAIIAYFSAGVLTMTGGTTNPGLVGVGAAVGFL